MKFLVKYSYFILIFKTNFIFFICILDEEGLEVNYDLLKHEGLLLGGSSGINVAGAIRLAKELGPGKYTNKLIK